MKSLMESSIGFQLDISGFGSGIRDMIKHQTQCRDCGMKFFLEDAEWCIHAYTLKKGTKECPQCHNCICHGETVDQINDRVTSNILNGKFVPAGPNKMGWEYMCKTVEAVEV